MSDSMGFTNIDSSSQLFQILKNCADLQSFESLADYNDVYLPNLCDHYKMMSMNSYSTSGNISTSSYASDDSFGDNILEENGRISLAYENLRTIPRRIAERFATQTKCLDLSYNNFTNLSFLYFFEELHTLILDRNGNLNVSTLPYLPNLKILWLNNCDIINITDWISRIQVQCPSLDHLSLMGNPGITKCFDHNSYSLSDATTEAIPISSNISYREYVLGALPNLTYLDGTTHRTRAVAVESDTRSNCNGKGCSSAVNSASEHKLQNGNHTSVTSNSQSHKTSPSLSFKDIFRIGMRRKKSLQSSSTNS